MRVCLAPLSTLTLYAGLVLEHLGHDVFIFDDMGRCPGVLGGLRLPERLRLVDAAPGSKPLRRMLQRCEVLGILWDPWDAGGCGGWAEALLGYAVASSTSMAERVVVGFPGGAYAWSGGRVECGSLPRVPPPEPLYRVPLAAALAAYEATGLMVVYPPLLHPRGETLLPGRPEPINWVDALLGSGVLEASHGARLSVLDYRDAAETVALLLEGEEAGWYCIGGVLVEAESAARAAREVTWRDALPSSLVVEGPGAKRRTLSLLRSMGIV